MPRATGPSDDNLGLFSYEILALVGRQGAAPHDLVRLARDYRMLSWAGESQYYVEPKRLARLGYLQARKAPGRTRERTVYSLTERGIVALQTYSRTPARFTPLKSEPMVRLLMTDLVGEAATRQSLTGLREDVADLLSRLDEVEAGALALPHRRKYLLLIAGFMRELFELHLRLVDAVEDELVLDDHGAAAEVPPAPGRP